MFTQIGPHAFQPLRWWDRWRMQGRCEACYYPRWVHPMLGWQIARPLCDKRPAYLAVGELEAAEKEETHD